MLERHCRVNYECDCPWKRAMPYEDYRAEWFRLQGQISEFSGMLLESMKDNRTIAEIIESEDGEKVAYLWVQFIITENGFKYAEVQDIYIEEKFRNSGIGTALMVYAEAKARENGARVIRSGTGCENTKSIGMHGKLGYYQYRYDYEKLL